MPELILGRSAPVGCLIVPIFCSKTLQTEKGSIILSVSSLHVDIASIHKKS